MPDLSLYKVGEVLSLEDCGTSKGKTLRACKVNIGDIDNPITVVTAAPNVREKSRLAVAPVGSVVLSEDGEEITVQKTAVGGVQSEGMFCDSKMLGWTGGAAGVAVQMPTTLEIGTAPPASKPRPQGEGTAEDLPPTSQVQGLFEKKLTKEEKKKLAEEKRQARKAAKEAKKAQA
jgi:tRNA-binding EMAP/Myf-like protein